jgi:hypothetical protein
MNKRLKEPFSFYDENAGVNVVLSDEGDTFTEYADDHPYVKKWPSRFRDVEPRLATRVEQATAAPGEARQARRS